MCAPPSLEGRQTLIAVHSVSVVSAIRSGFVLEGTTICEPLLLPVARQEAESCSHCKCAAHSAVGSCSTCHLSPCRWQKLRPERCYSPPHKKHFLQNSLRRLACLSPARPPLSLSLSSCDSFPPTLIDKGCGLRTLSLTAEAELDAGAGLGSCTRDV